MKKSITRLSSIIVVLVVVISCSGKKEKLPELTYSGEEPRIQNPLPHQESNPPDTSHSKVSFLPFGA